MADWGDFFSWRGPICRCVVASEWNVEGGRLYVAGFLSFLFFWSLKECWIDGLGRCSSGYVGMRVSSRCPREPCSHLLTKNRIVEYATREQAQQAVNTLSNQNLMGRLVYVREVRSLPLFSREGG